jgi:hypothetical protein
MTVRVMSAGTMTSTARAALVVGAATIELKLTSQPKPRPKMPGLCFGAGEAIRLHVCASAGLL